MKKILIAAFITLFLCTTAHAFSVGFDVSGAGIYQTIDRLYLDGVDETDVAGTNNSGYGAHHVWSFEDANGYFTESFTLHITKADLTTGGSYSGSSSATVTDTNWDSFAIDVNLEGQFVAGQASFSSGSALMYIDSDNNWDYDAGEQKVAELTLNANQTMNLTTTSVGLQTAGDIDMLFTYTETYQDFWDAATDSLVGNNWLLSFLDGQITVEELKDLEAGDYTEPTGWSHGEVTRGTGWNVSGLTSDFRAVPEPTTMLLFGIGLLGLAGASRKKLS